MRIGIGQTNAHVGAIERNTDRMLAFMGQAQDAGCDLVVFPELAVSGYSPMDLMWHAGFIERCQAAIERLAAARTNLDVLVGTLASAPRSSIANRDNLSSVSDGALIDIFNRAVLLREGEIVPVADKIHLPSYDIYCEKRHYTSGSGSSVFEIRDICIGVNICEDLWIDDGPTDVQASLGADWIINLSASPFYAGKPEIRQRLAARRIRETGAGIVYVNTVGGQDGVVFDGASFIMNRESRLIFQAPAFREGLFVVDLTHPTPIARSVPNEMEQLREAIILGIRDYARKNGFEDVVIGVSGGIDSALVAALAVDALGAGHVLSVFLPSEFSSTESREDAAALSKALGIRHDELSIQSAFQAIRDTLPEPSEGLVDENIQPRLRGIVLMALANQRHALVLCPGNKSEIALGYNTLYGDTVGALAPIADLYKTQVNALARTYAPPIPERILSKPPSAELRPNQRDTDDLAPYEVLDPVIQAALERNASRRELLAEGFPEPIVDNVLHRLRIHEHKRFQLPPGIKLSQKAFGVGRRLPLTNGYRS